MKYPDREMLIKVIKAEIELDRLTELLANDYMQQVTYQLKESIDNAERS